MALGSPNNRTGTPPRALHGSGVPAAIALFPAHESLAARTPLPRRDGGHPPPYASYPVGCASAHHPNSHAESGAPRRTLRSGLFAGTAHLPCRSGAPAATLPQIGACAWPAARWSSSIHATARRCEEPKRRSKLGRRRAMYRGPAVARLLRGACNEVAGYGQVARNPRCCGGDPDARRRHIRLRLVPAHGAISTKAVVRGTHPTVRHLASSVSIARSACRQC